MSGFRRYLRTTTGIAYILKKKLCLGIELEIRVWECASLVCCSFPLDDLRSRFRILDVFFGLPALALGCTFPASVSVVCGGSGRCDSTTRVY